MFVNSGLDRDLILHLHNAIYQPNFRSIDMLNEETKNLSLNVEKIDPTISDSVGKTVSHQTTRKWF